MTTTQPKEFDIFEKIKNVVYCPECKEDPPNIGEEYADGHLVCLSCGLVCGEGIVDTRSEWRTFSNDEKPGTDRNRVGDGGNPLLFGDQLHTMIGGGKSGSAAIALSRTQQKSTKDKQNEKMLEIYRDIDAFCVFGKLNSAVVDASKHVGKLAVEGKWFQSFNDQVICAIIFEGCKRAGDSRNMKEIARLSGKKIAFNKQLAMINRKLTSGGSQGDTSVNTGASRATFAKDLMPRYCQQIGLPVWAETLAVQVAEAVNDTLILGSRTARNVAASVIYLVCHLIGHPRTVTEIYPLAEQAKGQYVPVNLIPG
ncbi:hypothetical protein K440DRAFT_556164 [Wilcoxina mikolae CBS 423.85]|nr:hypothetical protein K440DRAFT_556164 [Wilcoxina mikolae CBS 423.85]